MHSKILPMNYPPVTSWTWHANLLSVITNYEETNDWLYSNYIQLVCEGGSYIDFFPRATAKQDCPWTYNQIIKRETIELLAKDICSFFIESINMDNYIFGVFEQSFFFKGCDTPLPHELFIYGYDLEKRLFYVADFTFKDAYSYETVTFEQLEAAYWGIGEDRDYNFDGRGGIELLSFYSKTHYDFDVYFVAESIKEYIHSTNTSDKYRMFKNSTPGEYGLNVYTTLGTFLEENPDFRDYKPLHILFDHKVLMLERIKFMGMHGFLSNSEEIYEQYTAVFENIRNARNLFLKKLFKNSATINNRIIEILHIAQNKEKEVLQLLLDNLIYKEAAAHRNWMDVTGTKLK
ncbi:hypothetical protein [Paenibacillus sp. MMS18-CY102]|uniref:hypothetical protein n=1 Tax=Paenibacillus sp. MMS18-CY102 TaxID=2682849 RepID=UPI001365BC79|nr:hypothetical protein [Paenibacillus sp. MMS18-CY102]MWC27647.1 hypothetical protein [Paenibacillus sp. MMS18-CY102]